MHRLLRGALERNLAADDRHQRLELVKAVVREGHVVAVQDDHVGVLASLDRAKQVLFADEARGVDGHHPECLPAIDSLIRQSDTDLQRPSWAPGRNPGNAIIGTAEQWFDPLAFVLPAVGTFGNVKRNELSGPNLRVVDFSIFKNQAIGSRQIQFRVEVFNLFNRVNLNPPSAPLLFRSDATRIAGAERITSLATPARQLQLGVKLLF